MLVLLPALAVGTGRTITETVSLFTQPFRSVPVSVYVIVVVGLTTGLGIFVLLRNVPGLQE
jgi:hypothetical protein